MAGARHGSRGADLVIAGRSVKLSSRFGAAFTIVLNCFKNSKSGYNFSKSTSKLIIWLSGIKSTSPTQSRSGIFLEVEVTGQLVNDDKICDRNNIKLLRFLELNAERDACEKEELGQSDLGNKLLFG